jgi:Ca-activated chloride channel homolog
MIPETLHFLRPLWLAALVPAVLLLWMAGRSATGASAWRRVVDAHLLRHLLVADDRPAHRWPLWALGLGWAAATIALAGPTWEQIPQPTWTSRQPTVVALDLSPTMNVADLAPSRLARARHKLHDVLEQSKGGQVALVLYADEAFVASPLTDDGRVIAEMIPSLESGLMPGRGSRPARAIAEASALLDRAGAPGGSIVLLTASAGDDPEELRRAAAQVATGSRTLSILGIGTPDGAPLVDARGRLVHGRDGKPVLSRLDASELAAVASAGGGRFAAITADDGDVRGLLAASLAGPASFDRTEASAWADTWRDAGIWLVTLPLLLAPLAFRRGVLAALVLGTLVAATGPAEASTWSDLWATRDQQGQAALAAGRAEKAADLFQDPAWKAAAHYENAAFADAIAAYEKIDGSEGRYNLGNALARSGDLERAVAAYDQALAEQPEHDDARFNRDLVQRLIDQRKRQQQEKQQEPSQGGQQNEPQDGQSGQQKADAGQGEGQPENDARSEQGADSAPRDPAGGQSQSGRAENAPQDPQESGAEETADTPSEAQDEHARASGETGNQENSGDADRVASGGDPTDAGMGRAANTGNDAGQRDDQQEKGRAQAANETAGDGDHDRHVDQEASGSNGPSPTDHESLTDRVDRALADDPGQTDAPGAETAESTGSPGVRGTTEEEQAREQKLRAVPDDPGGLLRARIRRHFAGQALSQR